MEKHTLSAVHDDDLDGLLASLGLAWDLDHGKLECFFCSTRITRDNLFALFPDSGAIKAVCHQVACTSRVGELSARRAQ